MAFQEFKLYRQVVNSLVRTPEVFRTDVME
jgi:hypothetical protein